MKNERAPAWLLIGVAVLVSACGGADKQPPKAALASASTSRSSALGAPTAAAVVSTVSGTEVLLCDGKTKVSVPAGTPGTSVAGSLMAEWFRKNPNANWEAEERERHTLQPAAENKDMVGQVHGQTYGKVTEAEVALWKAETERMAVEGSRVFHSADELGSTIGVSCDMCHPHAANTHPETYPKYQTQLGSVALLRDMINWCIQHPVRGKPLASDDPRMRALESYILAQRKGKSLDYGKH
jgi:hypothetical protein